MSEAACHIVMIYCPLPSDLCNLCQQQGTQMAFEGARAEGVGEKAALVMATASSGSGACRALSRKHRTLFSPLLSLGKNKLRSTKGSIQILEEFNFEVIPSFLGNLGGY